MLPVLGGEVVERQQRIAVLGQAIGSSLVFDLVGFDKGLECLNGILLGLGHPDLLQRALGLVCRLFGILFRMLAVLCTQQRCSRVVGHTSPSAFQNPSAPPAFARACSATAICGPV